MQFTSNRGLGEALGFGAALQRGLAPDGGLYIPTTWPSLSEPDFGVDLSLATVGERLIAPFVAGDSTLAPQLAAIVKEAFDFPAPLVPLGDDERYAVLELFHGPTAAFKDFGARFLAACFQRLRRPDALPVNILVATSGDTGGAVAAAFHRRPGMQVTVRSAHAHAAPGYTNVPLLEALIEDAGECSGLATASTGEVAQPAAVTTLPYLLTAPLPDAEGRYERAVTLADQLGNSSVITVGVTYDRTPPTATYPLTLTVVPDADATIFQTVQLRGASYADDSSPEALPWAVAVVVSRAPITLAASRRLKARIGRTTSTSSRRSSWLMWRWQQAISSWRTSVGMTR